MTNSPVVERVHSAVYTVPTDAPEADGTLSWDSTTLVLATVHCGEASGLGYTCAPEAAASIVDDLLADVIIGAPVLDTGESRGRHETRDGERIARARGSIGQAVELYVDANGAHQAKQAVRVAAALADEGVTWFWEPVSSDHLSALTELRDRLPMEVTAGEYGYPLPCFEHMLAAGAVDCLQADATRCGGITVWLRVAASPTAAPRRLPRRQPPLRAPSADAPSDGTSSPRLLPQGRGVPPVALVISPVRKLAWSEARKT